MYKYSCFLSSANPLAKFSGPSNQTFPKPSELNFNIGAEIGVRRGRYSKYICKCNPKLFLTYIDPWMAYDRYNQEKQDAIYNDAVKNLNGFNVKIIRKTSVEALSDIEDRSLDFVFIDGNHHFNYVVIDIIEWTKKVKKNGMIVVHDYYPFGDNGVIKAVDAYTHRHEINPWFVTKELEPTAYWVHK